MNITLNSISNSQEKTTKREREETKNQNSNPRKKIKQMKINMYLRVITLNPPLKEKTI